MKSKSKESEQRILGMAAAIYAALMLVLWSCASLPKIPQKEKDEAAIESCITNTDCWLITITNGGWSGGTFYLNGARFAWVEGNSEVVLPITGNRLDGGHCATFRIRMIAGETYYSSKECVREGGHFTLEVDPMLHVWLTPWR